MFRGVLALVGRSVRIDTRSWQTHLARFGLMGAIYLALCLALWESRSFGAPGLRFFYAIGYLNLTFMTLMGISFFSTPISEEREEDTLGLMLMAGISPLGILIGKSGGRLIQALLLITVQYPFTLLAITMGGVTHSQVSAMYVGLTAYMLLLAGFGLLCSTIGGNNRGAASRMTMGLCAYVFLPWLASNLLTSQPNPFGRKALDFLVRVSVFQQMGTILTTGFADSAVSLQVISNLVAGVACFGLAWGLFGVHARQPAADVATRGFVARRGLFRWFSPGRAWINPFLWKDFHFVSGSFGMLVVRSLICLGLYGLAVLQAKTAGFAGRYHELEIGYFQAFLSMAMTVDASRLMARSLYDEVRGQTLSSLMMLPRSSMFVVYSKLAGAMLGWLPFVLVSGYVAISTYHGRDNLHSLLTDHEGPFVLSMFVLPPNLAALLALFMRWGAVPLAIALSIGLHLVVVFVAQEVLHFRAVSQPLGYVMLIVFNAACHIAIMVRIRRLGATG